MALRAGYLWRVVPVWGFLVLFYYHFRSVSTLSFLQSTASISRFPVANATLGFGVVYALSSRCPTQRANMLRAANMAGFNVTIPSQQQPLLKGEHATASSALADAVTSFLDRDSETSLILSEGVAWDQHIRDVHIPPLAAAVRSMFEVRSRADSSYESEYYYGNPANWDVLYFGCCGTASMKPNRKDDEARREQKHHMGSFLPILAEKARNCASKGRPGHHQHQDHQFPFLGSLNMMPKGQQTACASCSAYAYAITQSSAELLLDHLNQTYSLSSSSSLDNKIRQACSDGLLRCYDINTNMLHSSSHDVLPASPKPPHRTPATTSPGRVSSSSDHALSSSSSSDQGEPIPRLSHPHPAPAKTASKFFAENYHDFRWRHAWGKAFQKFNQHSREKEPNDEQRADEFHIEMMN